MNDVEERVKQKQKAESKSRHCTFCLFWSLCSFARFGDTFVSSL